VCVCVCECVYANVCGNGFMALGQAEIHYDGN